MLSVLSHIEEKDKLSFWVTTDGVVGTGFSVEPCDLEAQDFEDYSRRLSNLFRAIDSNILARIKLSCFDAHALDSEYPRCDAVSQIGFVKKKVSLYLDYLNLPTPIRFLQNLVSGVENSDQVSFGALLKVRDQFLEHGIDIKPIPKDEVEKLFDRSGTNWVKDNASIDCATHKIGIIRLTKQKSEPIDEASLFSVLDGLPRPYEVHLSFKKLPNAKARLTLEKRLRQAKSDTGTLAKLDSDAIENAVSASQSLSYLEFEMLVELKRNSETDLRFDLGKSLSQLIQFGDFEIETFGCAPSLVASGPGSQQHVTLIEKSDVLPKFLPLFGTNSSDNKLVNQKRALTLHRVDKSLYHFDLFNPSFSVFNSVIVGTSGKGKSVLTGLLTRSLLNDPNVSVIKVDVGGSHSKECSLLGGEEYVLSLSEPSQMNPFKVVADEISLQDKISILSRFLLVLVQEQGEGQISKKLRGEIENLVKEYIESNPKLPCIDDFTNFARIFSRRDLLKRWCSDGIYGMAFREINFKWESLVEDDEELVLDAIGSRLRYYNFSQIFQASDPEFAQAGLASVLTQFNLECLKSKDKRIVLICDETPFFIKSCFEFFKFSTANVRKNGHAVVLISQLSTDVIVNGDSGIIENSPQRFLFSTDGEKEAYRERFNLSPSQMDSLDNLQSVPGQFSEVLFQSSSVARKLSIKITPKEYWELTSSLTDKIKLRGLMEAVPNLTLQEAISCLSLR